MNYIKQPDEIKIMFINPDYISGFNSYKKNSILNHGLLQIATCAQKAGFDVTFVDTRMLKNWKDLECTISRAHPDVVATGGMSVNFGWALKCIDIAKKIDPAIMTVIGGVHASIRPDEALSKDEIDHIITGEGEISFIGLIQNLFIHRIKQPRLINGQKPELDELPFINRSFLPYFELNNPIWFGKKPWITIIAGRGCPYKCKFCQPSENILFGTGVRIRSPENVIAELIELQEKYSFDYVHFHDDCPTFNKKWIEDFCEKYVDAGFTQNFAVAARADILCKNEDMISILARAGCDTVSIGFESGSQRILDFLGKGTTVEQNIKSAELCHKYGIKIVANYMFGVPIETLDDVRATLEMLDKIKPDYRSPAYFTPYPGTYLYDYCAEKNISLLQEYKDFNRYPDSHKIKGIDYKSIEKLRMEYGDLGKNRYILHSIVKEYHHIKRGILNQG